MLRKGLLVVWLILLSTSAFAGRVSDAFVEGAFGVKWGATIDEIREVYPNGSLQESFGIRRYIVPHSKPVLKVKRDNTNISFALNSLGQVHAIGVTFDGNSFSEIYSALKTHFGDHETSNNSLKISWPKDGDIKMYLVSIPSGLSLETTLTIENVAPFNEISKEELGFN